MSFAHEPWSASVRVWGVVARSWSSVFGPALNRRNSSRHGGVNLAWSSFFVHEERKKEEKRIFIDSPRLFFDLKGTYVQSYRGAEPLMLGTNVCEPRVVSFCCSVLA
jgi:hypothetical protein